MRKQDPFGRCTALSVALVLCLSILLQPAAGAEVPAETEKTVSEATIQTQPPEPDPTESTSQETDPTQPTVPETTTADEGNREEEDFSDYDYVEEDVAFFAAPVRLAQQTATLVTDAASLQAGDQILIAASGYNYAMAGTRTEDGWNRVAITKSDNTFTLPDGIQLFTLVPGQTSGTFGLQTGEGYLCIKDNTLSLTDTLGADSSWTICNGSNCITMKAGSYYLEYAPRLFRCTSNASTSICLYKLDTGEEKEDPPATTDVAPPTASPAPGQVMPGTLVVLSCATEDAIIYYKTETDSLYRPFDPSTPISIDADTTIHAYAKLGSTTGEEVRFSYTVPVLTEIGTILSGQDGALFFLRGVVTLVDTARLCYAQDGTGAICLKLAEDVTLAQGDTVQALGALDKENGLPQLLVSSLQMDSGLTLTATPTTIPALSTKDLCTYVRLSGVTITDIQEGEGITITLQDGDGNTIQLRQAVVGDKQFQVGDEIQIEAACSGAEGAFFLRNTRPSEITLVRAAPLRYAITLDAQGCTVQADSSQVEAGATVTFTVVPQEGNRLTAVQVLDAEKKQVPTVYSEEQKCYSFTQPEGGATIRALCQQTYQAAVEPCEGGQVVLETPAPIAGERVRFTVVPDQGKIPSEIRVTPQIQTYGLEPAAKIPVSDEGDNTYAFIQPNTPVVIAVTFTDTVSVIKMIDSQAGAFVVLQDVYTQGESVVFGIQTNPGYYLLRVTADGKELTATQGQYRFTPNSLSATVAASFVKVTVDSDGGTVSFLPASGGRLRFTVLPAVDKQLQAVTVSGQGALTAENGIYSFSPMASEAVVRVSYLQMYQSYFSAFQGGIAVLDRQYHLPGEQVTITATPDQGLDVQCVDATADGDFLTVRSSGGGYTFTQPEMDVKVTVTFGQRYPAAVSETTEGTITLSSAYNFPGEVVQINVVPAAGKAVKTVSVQTPQGKKAKVSKENGVYLFTQPESSVTVTVTFKKVTASAKTGDESHVGFYNAAMVTSGSILAALWLLRRKLFQK